MPEASRDVDDFTWVGATLERFGRQGAQVLPRRLSSAETGAGLSGIAWGDPPFRVLYLHGGGQNSHTWDLVAPLVGTSGVAVDLPGHGHSAWRADQDYHPVTNSASVEDWLDATKTHPDIVVGMSLGGLTALALAARRPDLVPSLILVDILPGVEEVRARIPSKSLGAVSLIDGTRRFDSLEEMEIAVQSAVGRQRDPDSVKRGVWHNAVQNKDGSWRWRYDNLRAHGFHNTTRLWEAIEGITGPLTLVRGGKSPFVDESSVTKLRQLVPQAKVVVVPEAHHAVQSDAPVRLAEIVIEAGT